MDRFSDGTLSVVAVLRPTGAGWSEIPGAQDYTMGYPARSFLHRENNIFVISAVEVVKDNDRIDKGFEYHISMSHPIAPGVMGRCDRSASRWVLKQFGLDGWEEDNHVPNGKVRHFWRPVATPLVGIECECKAEESAIVEDKGDFVWRP